MCRFKLLEDQNGHIFVEIKSVCAVKIQRNNKEGIEERPSVYLNEFELLEVDYRRGKSILFVWIGNGRGISRRRSHNTASFSKKNAIKCYKSGPFCRRIEGKGDGITWRSCSLCLTDMFARFELHHRWVRKRETTLSFSLAHLGHFVLLNKRFYEGDKQILKFDDPKKVEALPQNLKEISRSNDVAKSQNGGQKFPSSRTTLEQQASIATNVS